MDMDKDKLEDIDNLIQVVKFVIIYSLFAIACKLN